MDSNSLRHPLYHSIERHSGYFRAVCNREEKKVTLYLRTPPFLHPFPSLLVRSRPCGLDCGFRSAERCQSVGHCFFESAIPICSIYGHDMRHPILVFAGKRRRWRVESRTRTLGVLGRCPAIGIAVVSTTRERRGFREAGGVLSL